MEKRTRTGEAADRYGFRWGPVDVVRMAEFPNGSYVLQVETDFKTLEIYISKTGRSVRVYDGNTELKGSK